MPAALRGVGPHALRRDAQAGRMPRLGSQLKPAPFPEAERLGDLDHHTGNRPRLERLFGNSKAVGLVLGRSQKHAPWVEERRQPGRSYRFRTPGLAHPQNGPLAGSRRDSRKTETSRTMDLMDPGNAQGKAGEKISPHDVSLL